MHIEKLHLSHFRGAEALTLELHPQLNVFAGMNGEGKSSILDATAILLSWLVNRIKHSNSSGRPITEPDIQNGTASAELSLSCRFDEKSFEWSLDKSRPGRINLRKPDLKQVSELAKCLQEQITTTNGQVNLPVFVYYPVNRAVLDIPLRIREKHRFDLLSTYDESLTSGANFRTFFEWFRAREDLENEGYRDEMLRSVGLTPQNDPEGEMRTAFKKALRGVVTPQTDPQLQAVRTALNQFMPQFTNLTVRRNPLRMEVEKNNHPLTVDQLSAGEKCLMAMIGDLARRMAIANPMRSNLLDGEGIVLIDEIDLHLHPKWQRFMVHNLIKAFPKCQFLISTHSPHVMTHVQPENLHLLTMTEKGFLESHHPSESYGQTVERILEDLMGLATTRPDEVNHSLQQIYQQIDRGELEAARIAITELTNQIGIDPDLVKAGVLIRRKELIGK
jgi:predicted ATP-binding protein involved in virulence